MVVHVHSTRAGIRTPFIACMRARARCSGIYTYRRLSPRAGKRAAPGCTHGARGRGWPRQPQRSDSRSSLMIMIMMHDHEQSHCARSCACSATAASLGVTGIHVPWCTRAGHHMHFIRSRSRSRSLEASAARPDRPGQRARTRSLESTRARAHHITCMAVQLCTSRSPRRRCAPTS